MRDERHCFRTVRIWSRRRKSLFGNGTGDPFHRVFPRVSPSAGENPAKAPVRRSTPSAPERREGTP